MKKRIFSILAIAAVSATAFTSCEKDEPTSSELGSATINGSVWADLDLTNNTPEGIEGMQVSVVVDTKNWDQSPDNAYNYEDRVYATKVAADGSYTLTIPATETGYNVTVKFGDVLTTRTLAEGETENVRVSEGNRTVNIFAGAVIAIDDQATITVLGSNTTQTYGSATINGTVRASLDIANWDVATTPTPGEVVLAGVPVNIVWRYDDAPYTSTTEVNTVAINADGSYTFTIATEKLGDDVCSIDWGILDFAGTQVQNNSAGTADSTVNGVWSATSGIQRFNDVEFEDGDINTGNDIVLTFQSN